jgi:hypothetical protein
LHPNRDAVCVWPSGRWPKGGATPKRRKAIWVVIGGCESGVIGLSFGKATTVIECVFAERRSIIYEIFAEELRRKLADK